MQFSKDLSERYTDIRRTTTSLCGPLKEEDFVAQPVEDVSPPKWHLGHTTWFFEKFILERFRKGYQVYNPLYNYYFNSYYQSAGDRVARSLRGNMTRPTTNDIVVYREYIDHEIQELLEEYIDESGELSEGLELGLHHEQQHQELLLTDIKYILGFNPAYPVYNDELPAGILEPAPRVSWLEMGEGIYEIGHEGDGFSFDNELSRHKLFLNAFRIMDRPVSNGEYLEFMHDGGYKEWSFWLSEAWEWLNNYKIESPLYWKAEGRDWYYYTLSGSILR